MIPRLSPFSDNFTPSSRGRGPLWIAAQSAHLHHQGLNTELGGGGQKPQGIRLSNKRHLHQSPATCKRRNTWVLADWCCAVTARTVVLQSCMKAKATQPAVVDFLLVISCVSMLQILPLPPRFVFGWIVHSSTSPSESGGAQRL
jgi:hypothetical protein